jgi:hypothetical protein
VNAGTARVAGCGFRAGTLPDWLTPERVLTAPALRGPLKRLLVGGMLRVADQAAERGRFNTAFRVGDYTVRTNSAIPEAEWSALARANPPAATEAASPEALRGYVDRLVRLAVERPEASPTLDRSLRGLKAQLGTRAAMFDQPDGKATIRAMLGAEEVEVTRPGPVRDERTVDLRAGSAALRFQSVLSQRSWETLLREDPVQTDDPRQLARHLRRVAGRLLAAPERIGRIAPGFVAEVAGAATGRGRAIVIGGDAAPLVNVEDNVVAGLTEGVHVATSVQDGTTPDATPAESVRICGNEIGLARQPDQLLPPRGIFVGNSGARVAIEGNRIVTDGALAGIEVFGRTGPHLVVRDNTIAGARRGVLFRPVAVEEGLRLWIITDNLATGGGPAVDAPTGVARVTGNVP